MDPGPSKNLRQSSSSPSGTSRSSSSLSSAREPLEGLRGSGFFPSWGIHHCLRSERSLGNLFKRSRMLKKFSVTWGWVSGWRFETKVLKTHKSDVGETNYGRTYAASRRKNHRMSSCALSQVNVKVSRTVASSNGVGRSRDERGLGGHSSNPRIILLK